MTKRQRAQVVELLRCAADAVGEFDLVGMVIAGWSLDYVDFITPCKEPYRIADEALGSILPEDQVDYRYRLLEAAARVEEGSWP